MKDSKRKDRPRSACLGRPSMRLRFFQENGMFPTDGIGIPLKPGIPSATRFVWRSDAEARANLQARKVLRLTKGVFEHADAAGNQEDTAGASWNCLLQRKTSTAV